ncbi:MAG: hypothetical protein ING66_04045 [Rhodocyclaceae bacterium]|nr:hypothetical protein [Rhodocyclaceae bacterium]MCA3081167.1 hypothetical protein [Rhodocyclaceae bacterium]
MFDRFSRSWQLVKASGSVLMQDKELLLFPLISSIAALIVMLCFALPMIGMVALDGVSHSKVSGVGMYVLGFLFYLAQYFVIFFFNAALVGAAMIRLDGGNPTLSDGLSIAMSKWQNILGYAAIAATVGLLLRTVQRRSGRITKFVAGLTGMGWTLATFLVVPVLVARDVGPVKAVKDSATMLKETWGENAIGQVGIGAAFGIIHFVLVFFAAAIIIVAMMLKSAAALVTAIVLVVVMFILVALVQTALSAIYAAALYRYAAGKQQSSGFETTTLANAFVPAR